MTATLPALVEILSALRRLAGPVFDKELRVASRRRRYYLLRFAYVGLLVFVTLRFWYAAVHVSGGASAVLQVSRLAEAGKGVIVTVVWFQFVAGQILAAVLLSDAISSEIRQRTLESLLVTPIGAVHIVLGKLLSRLLLLVLLLAISLPVLAVARVFGGVPWDYVVSGLCITLSGAVFAGSMSLLYSITYRQAYQAVLVVALWYLVVWGIFAVPVISLSSAGYIGYARAVYVMSLIDPIPAMVTRTQMVLGGAGGRNVPAPLLLHCLTILTAAAVCLALAVRRVRRVALAYQDGSSRGRDADWRNGRLESRLQAVLRPRKRGTPNRIRRIEGKPIVWKEQPVPFLRARRWSPRPGDARRPATNVPFLRARRWSLLGAALCIVTGGLLFVTVRTSGPPASVVLLVGGVVLHTLLVIRLAVAAASAVTREKEARTWPILLTTPLGDDEIVNGKAVAAFRGSAWLLVPLMLLYLAAALGGPGQEFPLLILPAYAGLAGTVVLLLGLGLYLSTRLKTTTGAVVSTLAVYLVPTLLGCGTPGPLWFFGAAGAVRPPGRSAGERLLTVALVSSAFYAVVGLSCLRAATRRLRRDIF